MASLINERIRFLHLPKTGGSWATQAIFASGVKADRPEGVPFHGTLADTSAYDDRFTFACVRHPLDLWRSYWAYRNRTGWTDDAIDAAASSDLNEFIEGLVEIDPGHASRRYEEFVGPAGQEIDFICRHERLAEDLCFALRLAGEKFDERLLRAQPPVNTSDYNDGDSLFSCRAAERLAAAEHSAIERFYPWEPIPARLLSPLSQTRQSADLRRRLADTELERRDARAELEVLRREYGRQSGRLRTIEQRAERTETSLKMMRGSRLMRGSRPLRRAWYTLRSERRPDLPSGR